MIEQNIRGNKKSEIGYNILIVVLLFIAGFLNSQRYLSYMGFDSFYNLLLLFFYFLLLCVIVLTLLNALYNFKKGRVILRKNYWIILLFAVIFKFFLLFVQYPTLFLPSQRFFVEFLTFMSSIGLMIVVVKNTKNFQQIKTMVWALGLGASSAAIIPLIFFPEMIGTRVADYDGHFFSGSFWNASVISYISVGWLLVALSTQEIKKKNKFFLVGMFILLVLGSLAGLSRASLVSIIFSVVVYLIASKKIMEYLKVIIVVVLVSVILASQFQESINQFMNRIDGGIDIQEEARTTIWFDYIEDIPDYFFLGEIEGNYLKYSVTRHGPHSVFLNWFSQFGIIGLSGFIVLLFGIVAAIKKVNRRSNSLTAACLVAWLAAYLSVATINETGFIHFSLYGAIGIILAWGRQLDSSQGNNFLLDRELET